MLINSRIIKAELLDVSDTTANNYCYLCLLLHFSRGDYRTGRRINMRKIIPYVASQFRKDKIWLRRTKPSKRQYQVLIAVDDSQSMEYNDSRQASSAP